MAWIRSRVNIAAGREGARCGVWPGSSWAVLAPYVVGARLPATGFQRWAEAAATHATDDRVREEGLLAHAIFVRGVLAYHRNDLDEAMTAYAQAQDLYDQASMDVFWSDSPSWPRPRSRSSSPNASDP